MSCGSLSDLLLASSWSYFVGIQQCFPCGFSSSFLRGGYLSELRTQLRLQLGLLAHVQERFLREFVTHAFDALLVKLQLCHVHDEASFISISMGYPSCTSLVELPRGAAALFPNTFLVELLHRSSVEDDARNWACTYVLTQVA